MGRDHLGWANGGQRRRRLQGERGAEVLVPCSILRAEGWVFHAIVSFAEGAYEKAAFSGQHF